MPPNFPQSVSSILQRETPLEANEIPGEPINLVSIKRTAQGAKELTTPTQAIDEILDSIVEFLRRYMRFEFDWQHDICALWAAYTWVFRSFSRTPYLYIFSPEANCGKTQLMNCLHYLSPAEPRRWSIVAPSEASLFRKIHKDQPIIFIDEIDVYFARGYDDPIVGILNAGYKIGARVPRCIGRTGELEEFEVFCPKCFTGIGKLPSTTASRSIHIKLTRQASDDMAASFREMEIPNEVKPLVDFLGWWSKENAVALRAARPQIPEDIKDGRKIEIIEPLLAIAELAGPEWTERARNAASEAFNQNLETQSDKVKLLAAIRSIFLTKQTDRVPTDALLKNLIEIEDGPFAGWWERDLKQERMRGPAMKLAKMLKDFGIHSQNLWVGDDQIKGYLSADFATAWKRYLPAETKQVQAGLGL